MISRRRVILAVGAGALTKPLAPLAQTPKTLRRIGVLRSATPDTGGHLIDAFRGALRELGWIEGQTIAIEMRYANNEVKRMDALAAELVALKPDLIFAATTQATQAVQRFTRDIPIVFALPIDPIGSGLIANWARPGGNATGLSSIIAELGAKRLQLLKECIPAPSRVVVLNGPASGYKAEVVESILRAGKQLGIGMAVLNASNESEIDAALDKLTRERPDGIVVMEAPLIYTHRRVIITRAAAARIPAIYTAGEYADAGGLMGYGANLEDQYRRAATYVDKILRGAKPADLPVEQPTKFELIINLKTAKALGLKIPQSVLLRADRVIE